MSHRSDDVRRSRRASTHRDPWFSHEPDTRSDGLGSEVLGTTVLSLTSALWETRGCDFAYPQFTIASLPRRYSARR